MKVIVKYLNELLEKIDSSNTDEELLNNLLTNKDEVHKISNLCKEHPFFKEHEKKYDEFKLLFKSDSNKIVHSFYYFLNRMDTAPFSIFMLGSLVLCFPLVSDFIKEYEGIS